MNRFDKTLAGINDRLDLPQPVKFRVMREMAADLEDMFEHFRSGGMSEDEAQAKAVERIAADDRVIEQLIEIHETPLRRYIRKLSAPFRRRMELGLWIVLLITAMCVTGIGINGAGSLAGSPFAWITGVLAAVMISITAARWYGLIAVRDHRIATIRRGLRLLLFLAGLTGILAILGFTTELGNAADLYARTPWESPLPPVSLFIRSFLVASLGLAAATAGAVMWFILIIRTQSIEEQELAFRIEGNATVD